MQRITGYTGYAGGFPGIDPPRGSGPKRVSSAKRRGAPPQGKSLITQFEKLDLTTRSAINQLFEAELVKQGITINELMQEQAERTQSRQMINAVFPPQNYGYDVIGGLEQDDKYDQ